MTEPEPVTDSPPPAARKGGGLLSWFVAAVLVGGGAYAYFKGWLDRPLALLDGGAQQEAGAPAPTAATPPPPVPAELVDDRTPPAATDLFKDNSLVQLEAMQVRVRQLEAEVADLQVISERQARQLDRQSGNAPLASRDDLSSIMLLLIDMRLRQSGDTHQALQELEALAGAIAENSPLAPIIATNRKRLTGIQPRTVLLDRFATLKRAVAHLRTGIDVEIAAQEAGAGQLGGWLANFVTIRPDDAGLRQQARRLAQLGTAIDSAQVAMLLNQEETYIQSLMQANELAASLLGAVDGQELAATTGMIDELLAAGFPAAWLTQISGKAP